MSESPPSAAGPGGAGWREQLRRHRVAAAAIATLLAALLVWQLLPRRVEAAPVVRREVARALVLTGRVHPPARPQVGVTVAGVVRRVLVREGDRVSAGQLLVLLDDAQAVAEVAEARALLAGARGDARADVERTTRELRQAERDMGRARLLHAAGAMSLRDLELAVQRAGDARAAWEAARTQVAAGRGSSLADVARVQALVDAAEARAALTRVAAPAAATVVARRVDPGDAVMPGQVLLELALDGRTEIVAFASEESLGELRPGAFALASADAYPGETFPARIARIASSVDPAQGTIEVRLEVPAPPPYLLPDMTVSVNVEAVRRTGALVVPRDAVRRMGADSGWVLVARGGRAVRRTVRLGITTDAAVEIRSGVAEGELVLPLDVEPGSRVRAVTR